MSGGIWGEEAETFPRVMLIGNGGWPLRIDQVQIKEYPPFRNFHLSFPSQLTVIAGPNGVGKSRLLAALVAVGHVPVYIEGGVRFNQPGHDPYIGVAFFGGGENFLTATKSPEVVRPSHVFLSATRKIQQIAIPSLRPFSRSRDLLGQGTDGLKDWFVNTELHLSRGANTEDSTLRNYATVKRIFNLLDPKVSFSRVDHEFDILLELPQGELKFELLSSGFQSAFKLLFEILTLVEGNNQGSLAVEDYAGVILIDEIDVHLHPTWQGSILQHLRTLVPNAQIIATTHSAHVIQGLKKDELIALELDSDGYPRQRVIEPSAGPFGFQGWTVEEILRDVMGLEDTISPQLQQAETGFNAALDDEDAEAARPYYEKLMAMLHPRNGMRRVYDLQFESIGGVGE